MNLRAQAGGRIRRHVPDFLLASADGTVRVVNVKPPVRLADPAVVWSGADPVLLANIRFLAGYRRQGTPTDAVTAAVLGKVRPGERVGGLPDRLERSRPWPVVAGQRAGRAACPAGR